MVIGVLASDVAVERTPALDAPSRPRVHDIAALPVSEAFARLTTQRQRHALDLLDFLSSPRQRESVGSIVQDLCERFLRAGLPLDRYASSTTMVTADHDAISRIWRRDGGVEEVVYVRPDESDSPYLHSPFREATETGQWVEMWVAETPDQRFGVVADFKAAGFVHYLCIPTRLTNGADGWATFATKLPSGFSEQDVLTIAVVVPALMMRIDARVGWLTLDKLLRTYVGDEPHHAILAGRAKRGQVTVITAAMLVADLRDSTGHMATLGVVPAVALFNDLFDCLVPGIEGRRGEVLKYLGDGLLAIFREDDLDPPAAERALEAAEAAFAAIAKANAEHPARRPMEIGVALHFGEVAYGNVGSGSRLDFTVIGRDVALATRIAAMNAKLGHPLLLSAAFAARLHQPVVDLGAFPARGFDDPVRVFQPALQRFQPALRPAATP